jgi:hypothetical protein
MVRASKQPRKTTELCRADVLLAAQIIRLSNILRPVLIQTDFSKKPEAMIARTSENLSKPKKAPKPVRGRL